MDRPLSDVRVLAIEQYGAGPFGTVHLADLGADVIKIEDPRVGGDVGRYTPPFQEGEDSLFFQTFNRNKRSIGLDLGTDAGRDVFLDLVKVSDAVYSNLRGDLPERLRLRYDDLKHVNPRIVCCSLSGYGMTGPRKGDPAYDYMVQGVAGWMSLTGEPDAPPTKTGLSLVDFGAGLVAALATMIGVHAARRDGAGMDCDVSLFDTAMAMLSYVATWHLSAGYRPARTRYSAHPSLVPFQNFRTADGWIVVGCPKPKFWERLCRAVGRPELLEDERFPGFEERERNRGPLLDMLEPIFAAKSTDHWLEELRRAGVPCAPVNDVAQAVADAQTQARGLVMEVAHPVFGAVRQIASPVRVGPGPVGRRPAPGRNADAADVLTGLLGYTRERVLALADRGAFGPALPAVGAGA